MGAPIQLAVSDRPAKQAAHEGFPPEQGAASDPEVHIRLDYLLAQLHKSDPTRIVVAIIQLLWMSVLRFQHMQRSMPLKLTAHFLYCVCWKGKGKPGYRWACPQYGPTGTDVGGCIWDSWAELANNAHAPPFGLLYNNGIPLSLAHFHAASRAVLSNSIGMKDAGIFSSYSLRRSMPTLAEMSGTHPDDADALGDWTSARSCKMRIRYADSREERAAVVKLTHILLVRQMTHTQTALSWDVCRHLLCSMDRVAIQPQANQMMANDSTQQETPSHLLGGLAKPKQRFDIAALPKRMTHATSDSTLGSVASLSQPSASPSQQQETHLPIRHPGSDRRWVMVKHKGAPHVHLLPAEGDVPLCRRRRGHIGKPIKRLQSMRVGFPDLIKMSWNGPDVICAVCLTALPNEERAVARVA